MSLLLLKKKKSAYEKILEKYKIPDNPTTLLADFYALDSLIEGFKSYDSMEDRLFNTIDPRGFSGEDPEYKEKYIMKGVPDLPKGFIEGDLQVFKKLRDEVGDKLYDTLSVVMGYAILREGRYTLTTKTLIKDVEITKYFMNTLYQIPPLRDTTDSDVVRLYKFIQSDKSENKESFKKFFESIYSDMVQIVADNIKPKKPYPKDESYLQEPINPTFVDWQGKVQPTQSDYFDPLTVEQAVNQFGIDFVKEKWGEDVVNKYFEALNQEPEIDKSRYYYDLFEGTDYEYDPLKEFGVDVSDVQEALLKYLKSEAAFLFIPSLTHRTVFKDAKALHSYLIHHIEAVTRMFLRFWRDQVDIDKAFHDVMNNYNINQPTFETDSAPAISDEYYKYFELCDRVRLIDLMERVSTYTQAADSSIEALKLAFGSDKVRWISSYGGKKWYNIAVGYEKLRQSKSVMSMDFAVDIIHNTGNVFDKVVGSGVDGDTLVKLLDTKTFMGSEYNARENVPFHSYNDGEYVPYTNLTPYLSSKLSPIYDKFAEYYEGKSKDTEKDNRTELRNYLQERSPEWLGRPRLSKRLSMR